jgi:hypothetical protein
MCFGHESYPHGNPQKHWRHRVGESIHMNARPLEETMPRSWWAGFLPLVKTFLRPLPRAPAATRNPRTASPHLKADGKTCNLAVHPAKSHGAPLSYVDALLVRSASVTCRMADLVHQAYRENVCRDAGNCLNLEMNEVRVFCRISCFFFLPSWGNQDPLGVGGRPANNTTSGARYRVRGRCGGGLL